MLYSAPLLPRVVSPPSVATYTTASHHVLKSVSFRNYQQRLPPPSLASRLTVTFRQRGKSPITKLLTSSLGAGVGVGNPEKKGIPTISLSFYGTGKVAQQLLIFLCTNILHIFTYKIHSMTSAAILCMRLTLPESSFHLVPVLYLNLNLVRHGYISIKHLHVPAIIPRSWIRFLADLLP
jgi:hypothetical protein